MKTREQFPYIYFFMEPNVVFVYKIETKRYLNVTDLYRFGEWQTYELHHKEEFQTFHHEEWEPLVGRGYFINGNDQRLMVQKINELIQKHKKRDNLPVHIVSSQTAAGSVRVGMERPNKVIGFDGYFSIGPLRQLDHQIGRNNRFEWFNENINLESDDYYYENHFSNTLLEIEDIPEDVPIYLWTGNNSDEQTSLRFILHLLKDKTNDVILLNVTEISNELGACQVSELHPEQLKLLFEKGKAAKLLSNDERVHLQNDWEALAQTTSLLRVWRNGRIEEVEESYYDPHILRAIDQIHRKEGKKDFIRAGKVILEVKYSVDEPVFDVFLEYRLRYLIYTGVLELKGIPKSMRHYFVKVQE
ncbi:DUF1835 domain-containing protein [Bacillus sp. BRMEA1]|uniref:DUF1835 domain-containing protein n=1 Tax=Neobacillus endophyticus TaxID=2738405 RepID=UPI001567B910|nr:DUF1835 domain-containing protein [Neobacillus endophyticus]NRD76873.1 DUF1835 domain-containing protein [Neobacillus endophyticus]